MSLPFLALRPTGTSSAFDEPDIIGSIVEQVAAGHVADACRLAVHWCGLTNGRRAQCDANSGLLWKQLTKLVFPMARAPAPADGAHGYEPKNAQSASKEWFYYLCKQIKAIKERREDYAYAKLAWEDDVEEHYRLDEEDTNLDRWHLNKDDWIRYQSRLARLEEKVRKAGQAYPQDVAERALILNNLEVHAKIMEDLVTDMPEEEQLELTTQVRFHVEEEHMADLFQFPKSELETDEPEAYKAWSRQQRVINARLQRTVWATRTRSSERLSKRDSARRYTASQDRKHPREAELTALVSAAEARLNTTPMKATSAEFESAEEQELRRAVYALKYSRGPLGRTFETYATDINRKKSALERALASLLD